MITLFVLTCMIAAIIVGVLVFCGALIFPFIDVAVAVGLVWLAWWLIEAAKKLLERRQTKTE